MLSSKQEMRGTNVKPLLSELYSEEEKYWDSIDSRKSDPDAEREFILKQAKSQQQQESKPLTPNNPVHTKEDHVEMVSAGAHPTIEKYKFIYTVDHLATLHYPEVRYSSVQSD